MFKAWTNVLVLGVVFLVLSISLYFTWYKHLSTDAIQK